MNKLILIAAVSISTAALADDHKSAEVIVPQSKVSWVQPYGPKGPSFGFVDGKFGDKNPASFFAKMAAGGDSGWHTHDEDYSAVVIQGTFTEQQHGDAKETTLAPGTYFTQPAKIVHRNGCVSATECIIFVHFDRGASSTPTTRDGQPVTAK
jgi:quercetin dioxygenase-like cupin family protein